MSDDPKKSLTAFEKGYLKISEVKAGYQSEARREMAHYCPDAVKSCTGKPAEVTVSRLEKDMRQAYKKCGVLAFPIWEMESQERYAEALEMRSSTGWWKAFLAYEDKLRDLLRFKAKVEAAEEILRELDKSPPLG